MTIAENDVAAEQPRTKPAPLPLAQPDEPTVSVRLVVRLLGPLEVECGNRQVRIGAAKERLLLVLLALNDDDVWPGFRDGGAWRYIDGMPISVERVTHWMPMPPAPAGRAAEGAAA